MRKTTLLPLLFLLIALTACQTATDDPTSTPTNQQPAATAPTETDSQDAPTETDSQPSTAEPETATAVAPPSPTAETPSQEPAQPEDVTIEGAEGITQFGTFHPGAGPAPWPGVLLLHMNTNDRHDWDSFVPQLVEAGYAVLAIDMRGHGQTGGVKEWDKAETDLTLVWDYLSGREDVLADQSAIIGASIGANMALRTGVNKPTVQAVGLLSPGLNYLGVTTDDAVVEYGQRPLFIAASEEDQPAADSSRTLAELATGPVDFHMYEGAGHGTNMFAAEDELSGLLVDWLNNHLQGQTSAPPETAAIPASTIFQADWEDKEIFRSNLVSGEQGVLAQLTEAPVYHLDLSLSEDMFTLDGRLETRYINQEATTLSEIYFHLFPNLPGWGAQLTINNLAVNGQPVEPVFESQQVELQVPLSQPLAPGQAAVVQIDFSVAIPDEPGANYGIFAQVNDVLALAHFYPQLAVYDDEGWNNLPPPDNADPTYGDASFYLVRLTLPAEQVVVASGEQVEATSEAGQQTLTFAAGPARDFYAAISSDYISVSQMVGETEVISYGFPEFQGRIEESLEFAVAGLTVFNERIGPYPYTEFEVAPTYNLALGVEYPGVVVLNARLHDPDESFGSVPSGFYLESTVVHEAGHQWFYNLIGNDQLDEPWLDESLVQYVTYLYHLDVYGPNGAEGFRNSLVSRWNRVNQEAIPIGQPAGNYEGGEYSAIVYGRGPLFFEALSERMGEEEFGTFLHDYYQRYKWGIIDSSGLQVLAEEHCGCELDDLFEAWVYTP